MKREKSNLQEQDQGCLTIIGIMVLILMIVFLHGIGRAIVIIGVIMMGLIIKTNKNTVTKDKNTVTKDKNTVTEDNNTVTEDNNTVTEDDRDIDDFLSILCSRYINKRK